MEQVLFAGSPGALDNSATEYAPLAGGYTWSPTELTRTQVISASGIIKNLRIVLAAAPSTGDSYAFVLMVNGSPSALTLTISDTATTGQDLVNQISVVAGDYVSLRVVPTSLPDAVVAKWSSVFSGSVSNESLVLGCMRTTMNTSTTQYMGLQGMNDSPNANIFRGQRVCSAAGTIKNFYVKLTGSPGAGDSFVFTLNKNGVNQTLTATVSELGTTGNDTVNSFIVAAGDLLTIEINPAGTPNDVLPTWGMTFVADVDGESPMMSGSKDRASTSLTEYNKFMGLSILGGDAWTTTETDFNIMGQSCTLRDLYVEMETAPGTGESWAFTVRIGGAGGNLTTTISNTDTKGNDQINSDEISNDNLIAFESNPSAGGPDQGRAIWGMVQFIRPVQNAIFFAANF